MPKDSAITEEARKTYLKHAFFGYTPKKEDPGNRKGSALPLSKNFGGLLGDLKYGELKLTRDRAARLGDFKLMLNTFMEGPCNHFTAWCTCDKPKLTFTGASKKRAERLVNEMLERILYWSPSVRGAFVYNGLFREEWIKVNIDWNPEFVGRLAQATGSEGYYKKLVEDFGKGLAIGNISRAFHLEASTMGRNSDQQDELHFDKAFYQVPDIKSQMFSRVTSKGKEKVFFPAYHIIQPRIGNWQHDDVRYSRSLLTASREQYNRCQLMSHDTVVNSRIASSAILVYYIKKKVGNSESPGAKPEEIEAFINQTLGGDLAEFEPGSQIVLSGTDDVEIKTGTNIFSTRAQDMDLQLGLLFANSVFPIALAGFYGQRSVQGEALETLKKNAEIWVKVGHEFEFSQILAPLIYEELAFNGIFNVKVEATYPVPTFESKSVMHKMNITNVDTHVMSRQSFFEGAKADTWDEEKKRMFAEHEEFTEYGIDLHKTSDDILPENSDKGDQGKEGSTSDAVTPTTEQAGISDDKKNKNNQDQSAK